MTVLLLELEAMQEHERWLAVDEIAAHIGVNRDTVYKWIERKQLPAHKLGKLWKFKVSEVDEWILAGKAAEQLSDSGTSGSNCAS